MVSLHLYILLQLLLHQRWHFLSQKASFHKKEMEFWQWKIPSFWQVSRWKKRRRRGGLVSLSSLVSRPWIVSRLEACQGLFFLKKKCISDRIIIGCDESMNHFFKVFSTEECLDSLLSLCQRQHRWYPPGHGASSQHQTQLLCLHDNKQSKWTVKAKKVLMVKQFIFNTIWNCPAQPSLLWLMT